MSIQELIGKKLTEPQSKDAIHIAVAPVTASETLYPGQQIGFLHGIESDLVCATSPSTPALGIVDPFLTEALAEGEKFFMFLLPNTVTGMRHEWQHPAWATGASVPVVDSGERVNASARWISEFASEIEMGYSELMEAAAYWVSSGDYTYDNSEGYKNVRWELWSEFWLHYSTVMNEETAGMDDCPFTCSC